MTLFIKSFLKMFLFVVKILKSMEILIFPIVDHHFIPKADQWSRLSHCGIMKHFLEYLCKLALL